MTKRERLNRRRYGKSVPGLEASHPMAKDRMLGLPHDDRIGHLPGTALSQDSSPILISGFRPEAQSRNLPAGLRQQWIRGVAFYISIHESDSVTNDRIMIDIAEVGPRKVARASEFHQELGRR
jgi:hypothetical protein